MSGRAGAEVLAALSRFARTELEHDKYLATIRVGGAVRTAELVDVLPGGVVLKRHGEAPTEVRLEELETVRVEPAG